MKRAERKRKLRELQAQLVEGCPCIHCQLIKQELEKLTDAKD